MDLVFLSCWRDCLVSLFSGFIIIILFVSELTNYLKVNRTDVITIDNTRNEKLHINFNISLYGIPCSGALYCFIIDDV